MTIHEVHRQVKQCEQLVALGFTWQEAEALRRISMTLHRWYELECGIDGGCIERDEETGKAYWLNSHSMHRSPIADREKGALKRLEKILKARNERVVPGELISYYIQTDPRGAALYLLRPGDLIGGMTAERYYTNGICVY